jgi:hypothetical protein
VINAMLLGINVLKPTSWTRGYCKGEHSNVKLALTPIKVVGNYDRTLGPWNFPRLGQNVIDELILDNAHLLKKLELGQPECAINKF